MTARDRNEARRRLDGGLIEHARQWEVDGDLIRCRTCGRGHLASKAGELFVHADGCAARSDFARNPWRDLADLLRELPGDP
ncbi:hypothetical protein JR044_31280 [Pseudomonas aeruginosa]|jgi:hypothetical protein|uniref:hypothetical protein n=1 Tax=Pseudomonas aeruginosa TaxID=287 RepID=UPI001BD3B39F|nr:hypothetical protein [Pseudomonas aeruginosa]MBS9758479.1 hypothetical protein [Pseudomonas aeruginosa]